MVSTPVTAGLDESRKERARVNGNAGTPWRDSAMPNADPIKPSAPMTAADIESPIFASTGQNRRRPRLLVLASTFPAGLDSATPGFVRDLAGVEATVFDTTVLVPSVASGARRERSGSFDVWRFRYFPRRWEDLADGAILENLRARRSRWLQVPALLGAEAVALARAVRRLRPDVLHVHWLIPQGIVAIVAARKVPLVVTTLGGDVYSLTDPVSEWLISQVLRRATYVTTMNSDMRDRLLRLGADPDRTVVMPMGADIAGIRAAAVGVARQPNRVLMVGRLVEKKGVTVLLDAIRRLPDLDGLVVRVVGDGPLRAPLEEQAVGLPVTFLGGLGRDELAREYAAAAVAVFPSVPAASGDQDGLPVALLEALASGCAVIASDLPGLNDAVHHDNTGLLVPPGDAVALAAAIQDALSDEARRDRLAQAGRVRADAFSLEAIGARYVDLLEAAVREHRAG